MSISTSIISEWQSEVNEIRTFLDENYQVSLGGPSLANYNIAGVNAQLAWGRIGVEKFCDRVIPRLTGKYSDNISSYIPTIRSAIRDCVSFGSSTIIVDANGEMRISSPENSAVAMNAFGNISFQETFDNIKTRLNDDGFLEISRNDSDKFMPTDTMAFTIFYNASASHPFGVSRISPAIRNAIRAASRNKLRAEIASNYYTYPQRIINGAWDGIADGDAGDELINGISKIVAGVSQVIMLPKDPDTGEKMDLQEWSASDGGSYERTQTLLATEVATAFNIDPSELGVIKTNPASAEALYATKEDLVLEVSAFEQSIRGQLQAVIVRLCETLGIDDVPTIGFAEPSTPSKASQADAFVKLASVLPQLKYSPAALSWAGLPDELANALIQDETKDETQDDNNEDTENE